MDQIKIMSEIEKRVKEAAESRRQNAAHSGTMHDNGASDMVDKHKVWLDGINFAKNGTSSTYRELIQSIKNEANPEYIEYQRLKEKFEK